MNESAGLKELVKWTMIHLLRLAAIYCRI